MTHCIVDGRGEDAKQAGHPASNSRQHSLTLHQGSVLQLPRSIWTHSKELIFDGGQDKASTLRRIERKDTLKSDVKVKNAQQL